MLIHVIKWNLWNFGLPRNTLLKMKYSVVSFVSLLVLQKLTSKSEVFRLHCSRHIILHISPVGSRTEPSALTPEAHYLLPE